MAGFDNNMPKSHFGMPSLAEYDSLEQQVELCRELGLGFVELNMNLPQFSPGRLAEIDFARYAAQGVRFNLHLPEDLDPASFHIPVRRGWQEYLLETARLLPGGAVGVLNMHLNDGVHFKLPGEKLWLYERYYEEFSAALLAAVRGIVPILRAKGTLLCFENTGNFHLPHIRRVLEQLLATEGTGLTWDIGHDYCAGNADRPVFEAFHSAIRHLHLHDANARTCHLEFYRGELDIDYYLRLRDQLQCSAVLEVKTAAALRNTVAALGNRN